MLKVTNFVMLDIPLKLEFLKYTVFFMVMVEGNYDVLVIMVFHGCFHGVIISYH